MRMTRLRSSAAAAIVLAYLSTAASCPPKPSPDQRAAQLQALARAAKQTQVVLNIARSLQETEISIFDAKVLPTFTLDKHKELQGHFKVFFDTVGALIPVARDESAPESSRKQSMLAVVTAGEVLLKNIGDTPSPVLTAITASLRIAIETLEANEALAAPPPQ